MLFRRDPDRGLETVPGVPAPKPFVQRTTARDPEAWLIQRRSTVDTRGCVWDTVSVALSFQAASSELARLQRSNSVFVYRYYRVKLVGTAAELSEAA